MVFKDGLYFTDNNFSLDKCIIDIADIEHTAKFLLNHDFVNYGNQIPYIMKNMVNKINNIKDKDELEKILVECLEDIKKLDTEKTKKYIYEITVGLNSRIKNNEFISNRAENIHFSRNVIISNIDKAKTLMKKNQVMNKDVQLIFEKARDILKEISIYEPELKKLLTKASYDGYSIPGDPNKNIRIAAVDITTQLWKASLNISSVLTLQMFMDDRVRNINRYLLHLYSSPAIIKVKK